jgi:4-hydroxy-tetrahydrodipicolinate synthase
MSTNIKLRGIIPPIGTPLTPDERVDIAGLRRLVSYLLGAGVDALFVNGTMGIFALLSDTEQLRAVETVVDEVSGRVPVIAGVSDTGTKRVIEKAKQVESMGVDYLTALPPFYYLLTQESCIRFYRDVAQAVAKPLFIYNNLTFTKFNLSLDSIVSLSDEPNIAGIKETNPDCGRWSQLTNTVGQREEFSVLIGTEILPHVALMLGAEGIVAGSHNIAAGIAVELYRAMKAKNFSLAMQLGERLRRVNKIFEYGEIWGAFEVALSYLGIGEKATAGPYHSVDQEERAHIEMILQDCGIRRDHISFGAT